MGKPDKAGAYANFSGPVRSLGHNSSLDLPSLSQGRSKEELWPRLRTGPEKFGRPGLLGGLRKRGYGGIGTPPRNRKRDRKSTRLNSSHSQISYAVFCLKKK